MALGAYLRKYTPLIDDDSDEDDLITNPDDATEECLKLIDSDDEEIIAPLSPKAPIENTQVAPGKRRILIDGSNVAISYAKSILGKRFDRNRPEAFSAEGLNICLEYFEDLGFEVKATIPNYRFKKKNSSNPQLLKELLISGKLIPTASLAHEDRILLQSALKLDAVVVSNDYFRKFYSTSISFNKLSLISGDLQKDGFDHVIFNRTIKYNWVFGEFFVTEDPYGRDGQKLKDILYAGTAMKSIV